MAGTPIEQPEPTQNSGKPTPVRKNLVANFIGKIWQGSITILFVPIYVHALGVESFGLVGFFSTLLGVLPILDMGLSTTLNRQVAKMSATEDGHARIPDLVRTMEAVYWGLAILAAAIVVGFAPYISHSWIHSQGLPPNVVQTAVALMGITLALQFPFELYSGALMGLQRQVLLNKITVSSITIGTFVTTAVVLWVSPTIEAFFLCQCGTALLRTSLCAIILWRSLSKPVERTMFKLQMLEDCWRFAASVSVTSLVSVALLQMDKILLSRFLPLREFGYYTLANTAAMSLTMLTAPIFNASFPVFSQLVHTGDETRLAVIYHRSSQLMAAAIIPAGLTIALFSREVMLAWTRDHATMEHTYRYASLLVIGTTINSLLTIPYALQLAHGWLKLQFYGNLLAVIVVAPLLLYLVPIYGGVAAAWIWIALNTVMITISLQLMYRKYLTREMAAWYLKDTGLPLVGALVCCLCARAALQFGETRATIALPLIGALLFTYAGAFVATPVTRDWIASHILNKAARDPVV